MKRGETQYAWGLLLLSFVTLAAAGLASAGPTALSRIGSPAAGRNGLFVEEDRAPAESSDSAVVFYNRGNAAYRAGRYAKAVEWYDRAIAAGARNGRVYYNLGNAYFRLRRIGRSILSYEISLRLDPRDEDARANLKFVSLLIADRVEEQDVGIRIREAVRRTLGLIEPVWLAVGLSVGFFGLCIVAAWRLLGGRRSGRTTAVLALCAFLTLGSVGILGVQRWVSDEGDAGIVLAHQVEARYEPSQSAKVAFILHEGTKVWVERREENWALVHIANGLRGWLPENVYGVIRRGNNVP